MTEDDVGTELTVRADRAGGRRRVHRASSTADRRRGPLDRRRAADRRRRGRAALRAHTAEVTSSDAFTDTVAVDRVLDAPYGFAHIGLDRRRLRTSAWRVLDQFSSTLGMQAGGLLRRSHRLGRAPHWIVAQGRPRECGHTDTGAPPGPRDEAAGSSSSRARRRRHPGAREHVASPCGTLIEHLRPSSSTEDRHSGSPYPDG